MTEIELGSISVIALAVATILWGQFGCGLSVDADDQSDQQPEQSSETETKH